MTAGLVARAPSSLLLCRTAARRAQHRGLRRPLCAASGAQKDMSIVSVEFEVSGLVQGVFFRAHTVQQARTLGLVGWVANTPKDTVRGEVQGLDTNIKLMKGWLTHTGSPMSRIEEARFFNERTLGAPEYTDFAVRRLR